MATFGLCGMRPNLCCCRFPIVLLVAFLFLASVESQRRVCAPGSVFRVACNTCRCGWDGTGMACTRKQCDQDFQQRPPPPFGAGRAKICRPGSFFKMDCNDCRCNADGTNAACTLKGCPSR